MKYALLIYSIPGAHESLPEAERDAAYGEYQALVSDSRCVTSQHLAPITAATTVRRDNGQRLVTDGPFADTKEFFGGYYIVEADDLDEAIEFADRIPTVRLGGAVEVRPIFDQSSPEQAS